MRYACFITSTTTTATITITTTNNNSKNSNLIIYNSISKNIVYNNNRKAIAIIL